MSFCAKGKHRLACVFSGRACKATVVVVVDVVDVASPDEQWEFFGSKWFHGPREKGVLGSTRQSVAAGF